MRATPKIVKMEKITFVCNKSVSSQMKLGSLIPYESLSLSRSKRFYVDRETLSKWTTPLPDAIVLIVGPLIRLNGRTWESGRVRAIIDDQIGWLSVDEKSM